MIQALEFNEASLADIEGYKACLQRYLRRKAINFANLNLSIMEGFW